MHGARPMIRRVSLALIAAGAVALAAGLLLLSWGGGEQSVADVDGSSSPFPIVTATAPPPSPTLSPSEAARPIVHLLARGETVPQIERFGVLFLDPETGGGELWDFSKGGGFVRSASRSYRYVTYEGPDGLMLLDTTDGSERLLEWEGKRLIPVELSPDGASFVGAAGWTIAVFSTDTLLPTAFFDRPGRDVGQRQPATVTWTTDSASVAVALNDAAFIIRVVFRGEELTLDGPVATTLQWSRDGTRLAAAGSGAIAITIYDLVSGEQTVIPARGTNPRWSPDDTYLASAHPDNIDAVRIFDTESGEEVLRVTGFPVCVGDYWYGDGSIAGGAEAPRNRTLVPEGSAHPQLLGGSPDATPIQFRGRAMGANADVFVLVSVDGQQLARLNSGDSVLWSSPSDQNGAYRLTADGRGVMLVGVGESGLCDAGGSAPGVELPPFESDEWPDYTPEG